MFGLFQSRAKKPLKKPELVSDLNNPIEINFTYTHKLQGEKNYTVSCFVMLLHN